MRDIEDGSHSHGRHRHGRAVGVQPRDPQRQPVRVSRRRAARRTPRARGAAAAQYARRRRRRRHSRSGRDRRGRRKSRGRWCAMPTNCTTRSQRSIVLPPVAELGGVVRRAGRAAPRDDAAAPATRRFWVCAERLDARADRLSRRRLCDPEIAAVAGMPLPDAARGSVAEIVRGWLESSGPVTAAELAQTLACRRSGASRPRCCASKPKVKFCAAASAAPTTRSGATAACSRASTADDRPLRREIEPVTSADYARFLYRWQHVAPASRLHGIDGTLQVIRQLEGYEIPAAAWETHDLAAARRRLQARVSRPLVLFRRGDVGPHLRASGAGAERRRTQAPRPSDEARADRAVRASQRGRADRPRRRTSRRVSRTPPARCWPRSSGAARRSLPTSCAARNGCRPKSRKRCGSSSPPAWSRPTASTRCARSSTRSGGWARKGCARARARRADAGRCSPPSTRRRSTPDTFARRLLARWGVVFRDVVARETLAPRWREILVALRRMEARGEIRGGRFVATLVGEQFALPDAIDALRAARRDGERRTVRARLRLRSAADRQRVSARNQPRGVSLGFVAYCAAWTDSSER